MRKIYLFCFSILLNYCYAFSTADSIQRWDTTTGLSVAYLRIPNQIVNINLIFDAGSSRDGNNFGLASLTNALVSSGGENLKLAEIDDALDTSGAVFSSNTRKDLAILRFQSLSSDEYFRPAFETLLDIVAAPNVAPNDFSRVKSQYIQYTKLKKQNPSTIAFEKLFSDLYENHPYGHPTDGTAKTLEKITVKDVKKFYNNYYCSENAIVVIVGDLDISKAKDVANKIGKALPSGAKAKPLTATYEAKSVNSKVDFPGTQATLLLGKLGVKPQNTDLYGLNLAASILGGGLDSRLMSEIRKKQGLVYSASSFFVPLQLEGPFVIMTQTEAKNDKKAKLAIDDVIRHFVENGATSAELEKEKNIASTNFFTIFTENSSIANAIGEQMFYGQPDNYFSQYVDNIANVSLPTLNELIKKYMSLDNMSTITVGPNE